MAKDYYERTYGVTKIEVLKQLLRQHRACAICRCYISGKGKNIFHLDHCHETGKPRGLVCRSCNRLLGKEDKRKHEESLGLRLHEYVKNNGVWEPGDDC